MLVWIRQPAPRGSWTTGVALLEAGRRKKEPLRIRRWSWHGAHWMRDALLFSSVDVVGPLSKLEAWWFWDLVQQQRRYRGSPRRPDGRGGRLSQEGMERRGLAALRKRYPDGVPVGEGEPGRGEST